MEDAVGDVGPEDGYLLVRIHVPELNVQKCLQFPRDQLVWDVKQQCLAALPKVCFFRNFCKVDQSVLSLMLLQNKNCLSLYRDENDSNIRLVDKFCMIGRLCPYGLIDVPSIQLLSLSFGSMNECNVSFIVVRWRSCARLKEGTESNNTMIS